MEYAGILDELVTHARSTLAQGGGVVTLRAQLEFDEATREFSRIFDSLPPSAVVTWGKVLTERDEFNFCGVRFRRYPEDAHLPVAGLARR